MPRWGKKKFSRWPGRHLSIWKNQQFYLMIHKASKHQKHNRKIRDWNPSRAGKINTVSCTCVHTPALGLGSMPAGCHVVCVTTAVRRNVLYLHGAPWKQWLLMQQAVAGLAAQHTLPRPREETTERRRLLLFTCCCAVVQPCLCGWTPPWVSSGSTEGSNVINILPSCRDCILNCCGWPVCVISRSSIMCWEL